MTDARIDTREADVEVDDVWLVTGRVARALGDDVVRRTLALHRSDPTACASNLLAQATKSGCDDGIVLCGVVERTGVRWARASGSGPSDEPAASRA